jgi:magnesium-transporting ATPase (P-type)
MDKFVKGFIVMSVVYLGAAAVMGIVMLSNQNVMALKFIHSHLNMLGWVSMMIYGVGYHILPRFMGRALYSNKIGEAQFYLANISLITMLLFYALNAYNPSDLYRTITVVSVRSRRSPYFSSLQYADDAAHEWNNRIERIAHRAKRIYTMLYALCAIRD